MEFLKKVNALIMGLLVLLAIGCGKDEKEEIRPAQQKQVCTLVSARVNNYPYKFQYDSSGKLIRIDLLSDIDNSSLEYRILEYNSAGKIAKTNFYGSWNNSFMRSEIYSYNAAGLLYQKALTENLQSPPVVYETFEYDSLNQLLKKSHVNCADGPHYSTYSYPANNIIKEEVYKEYNRQFYLTEIREWRFGTVKNPLGQFGYLDFGYENDGINRTLYTFDYLATSYKSTFPGPVLDELETNITYTFNPDDYPITGTANRNNLYIINNTYEYSCQ